MGGLTELDRTVGQRAGTTITTITKSTDIQKYKHNFTADIIIIIIIIA